MIYLICIFLVCPATTKIVKPTNIQTTQVFDNKNSRIVTAITRLKRNVDPENLHEGISIKLTKEKGSLPFGYIEIGTMEQDELNEIDGAQGFKMLFDTGSMSTWVPLNSDDFSKKYNTYVPEKSVTHNLINIPFKQSYGEDHCVVVGMHYQDTICISELCAGPVYFGGSGLTHRTLPGQFDGVLGMKNFNDPSVEPKSIADQLNANEYSVLQQILYANNKQNVFSVWYNKNGGIITFGGMDQLYYSGETQWHVAEPNECRFWKINGTYIFVGVKKYPFKDAILDTGMSIITVPKDFYDKLILQVDFIIKGHIDCRKIKSLPTLIFVFANYEVTLMPEDYVIKDIGIFSSRCYLGIYIDEHDRWMLGESFFRKVYTTFNADTMQIGFSHPADLS